MAITTRHDWDSETKKYLTTNVRYEGCVITTRERNYYDDSDFYAVVWDEEKGMVKEVEYATTRYSTYGNHAHADITPENEEKARQWLIECLFPIYVKNDKAKADRPKMYDNVVVVKGRKVRIGTQGRVFWRGPNHYTRGAYNIGIETKEGNRYFTAENNCKSLDAYEGEIGAPIIRMVLERESLMGLVMRWIGIKSAGGMIVM